MALLIEYPSGVRYSNQVGGHSTNHPFIEGFIVPLSTGGSAQNIENLCPLAVELFEYFFRGPKWKGNCYLGRMDEETADALDTLFKKYKPTQHILVNRNRLYDSCESWVHVTLHYPDEKYSLFKDLPFKRGILTWPNSD